MNPRIPRALLSLLLGSSLAACGSDNGDSSASGGATSHGGRAGSAAGQGGKSGGAGAAGSGTGGTTPHGGTGAGGFAGSTSGATGSSASAGMAGSAAAGATAGVGGAAGAGGSAMGGAGSAGIGGSGTGGIAGGAGTGGAPTACPSTALEPGESMGMVQVGNTMRTFLLHVPPSYTGDARVPLVLDFHGLMSTPAGEKTAMGLGPIADSEGFIVAWPAGIDNAWNVGPCCTTSRDVDDVAFARALVTAVQEQACIDEKRVYATGFSMGGGMSHYLACHAADVFAAVAPHAFDLLEENEVECVPARPISVLSFRGTNDSLVNYDGGESNPPNGCCPPIHFLGALETLEKWSQLSECDGNPTLMGNTQRYTTCAGGAQIGLVTIQGGGHAPGSARDAWDFLKTKLLP